MVKVWVADISPLFSGEKYDACYAALPDWRKKKADSLKQEKARAQSVGVWTLWTQVCRKEGLPENVSYNLSHSGNYVMCAYSTRPGARVGCDLEMLGEFREKTARRFFCQEEYAYILKEEREEERRNLFYRFWVLKESFLKAVGEGLRLRLDSFCTVEEAETAQSSEGGGAVIRVSQNIRREACYIRQYELEGGEYSLAACSEEADFAEYPEWILLGTLSEEERSGR